MPIFVYGINHKTAALATREKVAFLPEDLAPALRELHNLTDTQEVIIVSTCNRTEIFLSQSINNLQPAIDWFLVRNQSLSDLRSSLFTHTQEEAIRHLYRVACGLDSMVLGEPQILGQLKTAYRIASDIGTLGKLLNKSFQTAFSVAKQVRTDTAIGSSPVSIAFAAVRLAQQIFGDFQQQTALLIGAGDTIELAAQHLRERGINQLIIANRSVSRAQALAARHGGSTIALQNLEQHLARADIIISATASPVPLVSKNMVAEALRLRRQKPIFIVDIAVPRDIDAEVEKLDDVYLYTVDDLEAVIQENLHSRRMAARQAEEIINSQARLFMEWLESLNATATIKAIRQQVAKAQAEILEKAQKALLRGEKPEEVVTLATQMLVNKLTHAPTTKLREASSAGRSDLLQAARELFDLETTIASPNDSKKEFDE